MFVLKTQRQYVHDIGNDGLLIVTDKVEGYPIHPSHPDHGKRNCLEAKKFNTEAEALAEVQRYKAIRLPGKHKHSKLTVASV